MDKLTAIRIKYDDGTYSEEIPVSALAEDIIWNSSHNLVDILGEVDLTKGNIQQQLNEKFNSDDISTYVDTQISTDVTAWLNEHVNPVGSAVVVDNSLTTAGAAADAKKVGDELGTLNERLDDVREDLGLIGERIDYGTSCPLVIEDAIGTVVNLTFDTATSCFISNKNLFSSAEVTFTRTSRQSLPFRFPAGTYTFTADVETTDVDSDKCQFTVNDGNDTVIVNTFIGRGSRAHVTFTANAPFDQIVLAASDTYGHSADDVATYSNIQLEIGTELSEYVSYGGRVLPVELADSITLTASPTCIFTDDFSLVNGKTESGHHDPVIPKIEAELTEIKDDLGYVGHPTDYGSGCPLTIDDGIGVVVDLDSETASSCLVANKNLCDLGEVTFVRTSREYLPFKLPAGTYTFSADVVSTDVEANRCQITFNDGTSTVIVNTFINMGSDSHVTFTASAPFDNIVFAASDTYRHSKDDTATYSNIQLEANSVPTDYIAYNGQVLTLDNGAGSFTIEDTPTYVYTNDFSDIHGSSEAGGINPIIPSLEQSIEKLEPPATSDDIGKTPIVQKVENGKVTQYGFTKGPADGIKILSFGDSIWGNDRTNGIADFLAEYTGVTVYNGAVGGTRITDLRHSQYDAPDYLYFDGVKLIHAVLTGDFTEQDAHAGSVTSYVASETLPMLKALDVSTVDVITIAYGHNDITSSETLGQIQTALETIVTDIRTHYPRIRIIVIAPPWRMFSSGTVDGDDYVSDSGMTMRTLADGLIEKAHSMHVTTLDMLSNCPWCNLTKGYYLDNDMVHPNIEGNKVYAHIVSGKLMSMF